MSLLRYYARAAADPRVIGAAAAKLREDWDPGGEFDAPDGSRRPEAHAAAILGILGTGADMARVSGYLRRAEEAVLAAARSTSDQRRDLGTAIWRMMLDAAIQASNEPGAR